MPFCPHCKLTHPRDAACPDTAAAAAALGRRGGSVRSERKTAAVRENGKRGGRPLDGAPWYLALNTFHPLADHAYVLSAHRSVEAAERACRRAQPRELNSYLPTVVRISPTRHDRGDIVRYVELESPSE